MDFCLAKTQTSFLEHQYKLLLTLVLICIWFRYSGYAVVKYTGSCNVTEFIYTT